MKAIENRCQILDTIRGVTVLNMIAFHAIWDLVYLFGIKWGWYHGEGAYLWQQGICWSFIVLSGFCAGMSRHLLKRGMIVFGIGRDNAVYRAVHAGRFDFIRSIDVIRELYAVHGRNEKIF